ncbi:hypothetical protein BD311DRAFT_3419 [Dichomitus squalens]|uniref:C2H2-type domain-containing protein n=1 Tax=Dichomitus squalens TaxID=114155 RepID=A0A4Q9N7X1_9APHY|nr:hypothetical protein BD311DRAFT_3419 [Dichomitus squalens]
MGRKPCTAKVGVCPVSSLFCLGLRTVETSPNLAPPFLNKCAQCGQEYPIGGSHTQCLDASIPCPTCNLRFASRRELAQHVMSVLSCPSCSICLDPKQTLPDHWWTSQKHPKCKECKIGFEDAAGLSQVSNSRVQSSNVTHTNNGLSDELSSMKHPVLQCSPRSRLNPGATPCNQR